MMFLFINISLAQTADTAVKSDELQTTTTDVYKRQARICFLVSNCTFLSCVAFSEELTNASRNATITTITEA